MFRVLRRADSATRGLCCLRKGLCRFFSMLTHKVRVRRCTSSAGRDVRIRGTVTCVGGCCSRGVAIRSVTSCLTLGQDCLCAVFRGDLKVSPGSFLARFQVSEKGRRLTLASLSIRRVTISYNCHGSLTFNGMFGRGVKVAPARCHGSGEGTTQRQLVDTRGRLGRCGGRGGVCMKSIRGR